MTRYNPIKVPVGNLTGFPLHGTVYNVLGNIDREDQNDSLSVESDQVPRKSLVKGGPWTKTAGPQEPWCCFRLRELTECQKQLEVSRVLDYLFRGRKVEKEVRVDHRLGLCM